MASFSLLIHLNNVALLCSLSLNRKTVELVGKKEEDMNPTSCGNEETAVTSRNKMILYKKKKEVMSLSLSS